MFQGVGNKQLFLNLAKQRLKDNFQQKWTAEIKNVNQGFILS